MDLVGKLCLDLFAMAGFQVTPKDLDVAGVKTVGYGHALKPGESFPDGITEMAATLLLLKDVQVAEAAVSRLVKVPLNANQFSALVDFVYNLGAGRLTSSTLLKDLNAGKYAEAGEQLLLWCNAGGHPQPGLVTRRHAELVLWKVSSVQDAPQAQTSAS